MWDYLKRLELNKSPAATYFLAQFDARTAQMARAKALARLRQVPAQTRADWRCAQLLIDLTWKELTGSRLLPRRRVPLHLSSVALLKIAELASALEYADMPDGYRFLFVRAIAEFASGNYSAAQRLFRRGGRSDPTAFQTHLYRLPARRQSPESLRPTPVEFRCPTRGPGRSGLMNWVPA